MPLQAHALSILKSFNHRTYLLDTSPVISTTDWETYCGVRIGYEGAVAAQ